ncbi:GNAT family N-acetyltransferase [Marinigracilibium pacificum]|uniref:GNAT family N-acetyltransferase n=1 Tax=Marinigracilibium pacificum TaxID=2729599 RepID=A0A848J3F6_9BACT|nr:GNAT family N-acetyltransferase [Marinigracilibium pacificum]NMM49024.1 GNAT family N-acetyltransferase [Marinigracilibium pacificum]
METIVAVASEEHLQYASHICKLIEKAAKQRGTGIAKRHPLQIQRKMMEGSAIIALIGEEVAGFCYVQPYEKGKFVSHSALIVNPKFRGKGIAKMVKQRAFDLAVEKYPDAKIFGITTSLPVLKINSNLGYKPVTFDQLPQTDEFWDGCKQCKNHDVLMRTGRKHCLCTGMVYNPADQKSILPAVEVPKIKKGISGMMNFFRRSPKPVTV